VIHAQASAANTNKQGVTTLRFVFAGDFVIIAAAQSA
jgi:hypothetical protein